MSKNFVQPYLSISQRPHRPPKRWSPSPHVWYKVNMDGVVFRDQGKIGVGVVIRNDQRELMGAMSKKIHFPLVAVEAEAKAMEK